MRLLSVALHEKAESPAFPRGSGLQRAPRRAGWSFGRRCEGDGEKRRSEKAGPENEAPFTKKRRAAAGEDKAANDLSSETSELTYERRELTEGEELRGGSGLANF